MTTPTPSTATTSRFRVGGMDCAACASKVDTAVRRIDGVEDVSVSVTAGTMTVQHCPAAASPAIAKAVTSLGYTIADLPPRAAKIAKDHITANDGARDHDHRNGKDCGRVHDHQGHDHKSDTHDDAEGHRRDHGAPLDGPWWQASKAKLALACAAAIALAYLINKAFPGLGAWPYVAAMAIGLVPIAQRAFQAARAGTPFSIEMLMTIAAVGAVFIGAEEEGAAVVVLFLIGELLEGVAAGRARSSIRALTTLGVLIANLAKGKIGATGSHLLGAFLATTIAQVAEERASIPREQRRDFTLYADEVQNFATTSFSQTLSEARNWKLSVVLAHQFLNQLPDKVKDAIIHNCGSFIVFRIGGQDAKVMADELDIDNERTLSDTRNFSAWARLLLDGNPSDALYLETVVTDPPAIDRARQVIAHTRARHTRERASVEQSIVHQMRD